MTPVGVTLAPSLLALDCDAPLPVLLPYCSLLVARDCHNSSISLSCNKENFRHRGLQTGMGRSTLVKCT